MANKKVKLKNKSGDYLYPYTNNVPTASTSTAGIVKLDSEPTSGSDNALTSGAAYTALAGKLATTGTAAKAVSDASGNTITSTYATKTELNTLRNSMATDTGVVHTTGNESINGTKTFKAAIIGTASDANNSVVTTVAKSKSANGYYKLGNGLILQWGLANTGGTVTLPTAFTSTNYSVVISRVNTDTKYHSGSYVQALTTTNFTFNGADANSQPHYWQALGYQKGNKMQLNDIFGIDKYDEAYLCVLVNPNLTIIELEPENNERRFQIVEISEPTTDGVEFIDYD